MRLALAFLLAFCCAAAASAVIIDSEDGDANTAAPDPDPGWIYVGTRGGLTVVSLGGSFVLTANHVGAGNVVIDGDSYTFVPGTAVRLGGNADLLMFQIYPPVPLSALPISSVPPSIDTELILVGHGRDRGLVSSLDCDTETPETGYDWGVGNTMRWGTNHVEEYPPMPVLNTETFASFFDPGGSENEAQAANGDSGGAAFACIDAPQCTQWELAGILFAVGTCSGQPMQGYALYGNVTYMADLSVYYNQIMAMPEPSGGLWAGGLLVAALGAASRSLRRRC